MSVPHRMCVGCRSMKPKSELIRMVKDPKNGTPIIDTNQKVLARGIYMCRDDKCIALAKKKRALERFFKTDITDDIYIRLENEKNIKCLCQTEFRRIK